jgi:hypothetical protein
VIDLARPEGYNSSVRKEDWLMRCCLLLVLVSAACSSIHGRYIGSPKHGEDIGGLPIVVERLRWLKVTYKTAEYGLVVQKVTDADGKTSVASDVAKTMQVREISVEPVRTEEIYAIDLSRPAAGKIDYDLEFREDRAYPKRIKGTVEDKTIEQISGAVDQLLERLAVGAKPTEAPLPEGVSLVRLGESVERIEFYDVARVASGDVAPAFTLQ